LSRLAVDALMAPDVDGELRRCLRSPGIRGASTRSVTIIARPTVTSPSNVSSVSSFRTAALSEAGGQLQGVLVHSATPTC
jgi:hypothetical protein